VAAANAVAVGAEAVTAENGADDGPASMEPSSSNIAVVGEATSTCIIASRAEDAELVDAGKNKKTCGYFSTPFTRT
jgi:hypothetical protein